MTLDPPFSTRAGLVCPGISAVGPQKFQNSIFPNRYGPKLSFELLISLLSCIASSGVASRMRRLKNVTVWNEFSTLPIFDLQTCNAPQKISQSILITYLKQKMQIFVKKQCFWPFSSKNRTFLG